jgi:hypothetical protein
MPGAVQDIDIYFNRTIIESSDIIYVYEYHIGLKIVVMAGALATLNNMGRLA